MADIEISEIDTTIDMILIPLHITCNVSQLENWSQYNKNDASKMLFVNCMSASHTKKRCCCHK